MARAKKESRCRVCGCTDSCACADGCSWIWVDRAAGVGVCSNCGLLDAMRGASAHLRDYAEVLSNSYRIGGKWCQDEESQYFKKKHDEMLAFAKVFRAVVKRHMKELR